ncbi:MAG: chemotaxis-specific protein-glutamate methyltransferase CheB [Synechococcus lacustris]
MRIAIVNDLSLAIASIRRVIEHDGRHSIAWVARDGEDALARFAADQPDLILLDLVMPILDGVQTTKRLMQRSACPILIVTASVGQNTAKVYEAMGYGALDAVNVPIMTVPPKESGRELLHKISTIERLKCFTPSSPRAAGAPVNPAPATRRRPQLIAIGASTGGPKTLAAILKEIPVSTPAAFVVVQHIDVQFAPGLVSWLNSQITLPVIQALPGNAPVAATVCLSVTNDHLVIDETGRFAHVAEPKDEPYRPSVDVFFRSLVRNWRQPGQAVLLTGMGRDGAAGLLALRQANWHTIAQDEASCVVYGMPRAAAELKAAVEVLSTENVAASLLRRCNQR